MWFYHLYSVETWDFLPGYDLVVQADADGRPSHKYKRRDDDASANGTVWESNSQLQQISPFGLLTTQYISVCAGHPLNYNGISHECRVDHTSPRYDVLTTRMKGARYPRTNITMQTRPGVSYSEVYTEYS